MKKQDLQNPVDAYFTGEFPKQRQPAPGVEQQMTPRPDTGEESYRGLGRLKGRRALVTGGDSGIGRAVAVAFSREGADVAINYLASEQPDAETLRDAIDPALPLGLGEVPYGPLQVMHLQADTSALQEDTGWRPATPFEEGIRETIEWVRKETK